MIPFPLLETNEFIIFYKPPNWIVDTDTDYSNVTRDNLDKVLINRKPFHLYVKYYLEVYYGVTPDQDSYNCCQRLDKETSGAILVSIQNKNWMYMRSIINNKQNTHKIYIALVEGIITKKSGYILNNIKCTKSFPIMCDTIPFDLNDKTSFYSCSYYEVAKEYELDGNMYSLVKVRIFTGRTHQIRVHMKSIGHPIISDDRYSNKKVFLCDRMFLHNIYLGFTYKKHQYNVIVPVPYDLTDCLKSMTLKKTYNDIYEFHTMKRVKNIIEDVHEDIKEDVPN